MSNFSFRRMALVIRHDILSDYRLFRNRLIGLFLGITFAMGGYLANNDLRLSFDNYILTPFLLAIGGFCALFFAADTFSSLNSKTKRINALMLPATNLEKFAAYLTEFVVLYHIVFLLLIPIADLTQYLFYRITTPNVSVFVTPVFFSNLYSYLSHSIALPFVVGTSMLSTYVLGSACFRRQPFILTTLSIFLISFAFSILLSLIGMLGAEIHFWDYFHHLDQYLSSITFRQAKIICKIAAIVICTSWTIFTLWMSYRMFCRTNVITSKRFGF